MVAPAEHPIAPIVRESVMDAVADRLRDEILSGRLQPGSALPSERELALALGVNRLTLRAALARLETLGLIVTRHGARTTVASWRERAGLEALAALVGSKIEPENPAWRELLTAMMEVRRILAAEAVALAAERHQESDLREMEAVALEQQGRAGNALAFARGDVAFQRAVVRAAQNVGLELLLNTFARFPEDQPELIAALYDRPEDTLMFYPAVIELVRAGDAAAARELVRGGLEATDRAWRERHLPPEKKTDPRPATKRKTKADGSKKTSTSKKGRRR